jgi:CBS domain-containing protein
VKVRDVMWKQVAAIPQNNTLSDVVRTFVENHIQMAPVIDASERVVGLITVRDLADFFLPRYFDLLRDFAALQDKGQLASLFDTAFMNFDRSQDHLILAADIMKTQIDWVQEDDSLLQAASRLKIQRQSRLPVIDRDRKLVGMLSDFEVILSLLSGRPYGVSPAL